MLAAASRLVGLFVTCLGAVACSAPSKPPPATPPLATPPATELSGTASADPASPRLGDGYRGTPTAVLEQFTRDREQTRQTVDTLEDSLSAIHNPQERVDTWLKVVATLEALRARWVATRPPGLQLFDPRTAALLRQAEGATGPSLRVRAEEIRWTVEGGWAAKVWSELETLDQLLTGKLGRALQEADRHDIDTARVQRARQRLNRLASVHGKQQLSRWFQGTSATPLLGQLDAQHPDGLAERRRLRERLADPAPALPAGMALPEAPPVEHRPTFQAVPSSVVHVFVSPTGLFLHDDQQPLLSPSSEPQKTGFGAKHKRGNSNTLYVEPLANAWEPLHARRPLRRQAVALLVDRDVSYRVVAEVMYTLAQKQVQGFYLAARSGPAGAPFAMPTLAPEKRQASSPIVLVVKGGFSVKVSAGNVGPGCRGLRKPGLAIARTPSGYDFAALTRCVRRLNELSPLGKHVRIAPAPELKYSDLWHTAAALVLPVDSPFETFSLLVAK